MYPLNRQPLQTKVGLTNNAAHRMATGQKMTYYIGTDKAGAAGKQVTHYLLRNISSLAMIMRWIWEVPS